jgi:F420-non-reducing hydrogenase large subunit
MSDQLTTQEAWRRGSQGAQAAYTRRRITIDPITRLEGHGKIDIFLDEAGDVERAYFQVPELRGFEKFAEGRPAEDMPQITSRIWVCPRRTTWRPPRRSTPLQGRPPPAAKKIRELVYSALAAEDHALHSTSSAAPTSWWAPRPAAQRNILGVIAAVGQEAGLRVITMRRRLREIITLTGGKVIHPVLGLPGGVAKRITAEEQAQIKETAADALDFARFTLGVFRSVVLANPAYVDLIVSDAFTHRTYYMGLMDGQNRPNFYDGRVRVVTPEGGEWATFPAADYLDYVAEHVEPWSYVKFCYLKPLGWHGFTDGAESGIYSVAPLARLNVADGMATPLAQEAYEEMYSTLGGKPVHHTLANHWARVVELLYAAERLNELADDPELIDPNVRTLPTETPREGVGVVEAPRGTLYHHYVTDSRGIVEQANLIVATQNNSARMAMSVEKAAKGLISKGHVSEGILNKVEMAFRAYDPCHACATHSLPGSMPLVVAVRGSDGETLSLLRRDSDGSLHRE